MPSLRHGEKLTTPYRVDPARSSASREEHRASVQADDALLCWRQYRGVNVSLSRIVGLPDLTSICGGGQSRGASQDEPDNESLALRLSSSHQSLFALHR